MRARSLAEQWAGCQSRRKTRARSRGTSRVFRSPSSVSLSILLYRKARHIFWRSRAPPRARTFRKFSITGGWFRPWRPYPRARAPSASPALTRSPATKPRHAAPTTTFSLGGKTSTPTSPSSSKPSPNTQNFGSGSPRALPWTANRGRSRLFSVPVRVHKSCRLDGLERVFRWEISTKQQMI
jgi:hypothetical protein